MRIWNVVNVNQDAKYVTNLLNALNVTKIKSFIKATATAKENFLPKMDWMIAANWVFSYHVILVVIFAQDHQDQNVSSVPEIPPKFNMINNAHVLQKHIWHHLMKVVNPAIINVKHAQVLRVMNVYHAKEKEVWNKIDANV